MKLDETDWSLKIKNAENEGFKVISKLDEEGPGPAQHDGPRQDELPQDQAGQWCWRGGRVSQTQRHTHNLATRSSKAI